MTTRNPSPFVVFLLAVVAVLGLTLTVVVTNLNSDVDRLTDAVEQVDEGLARGRYERLTFQRAMAQVAIDQRRLTCIDLADGDTGATDDQYAECAEGAIPLPPEPQEP